MAIKLAIGQIKVIPASPLKNAERIVKEIKDASRRGIDVIAFPELAVPGYLIGDKFEYVDFLRQIELANQQICAATKDTQVTAIFGSVLVDWDMRGEDGRVRKFNVAMVASGGSMQDFRIKTLQPNYRYFNDDRHFFSARKLAEEKALMTGMSLRHELGLLLRPVSIRTREEGPISIGLHLCEDMWHQDYAINPVSRLYNQSMRFFLNLSASPWGWQKNRKRHSVVEKLVRAFPAPYIYVNKVGVDQVGKNIIAFDGCSSVYDASGQVVYETNRFADSVCDVVIRDGAITKRALPQLTDIEELYQTMVYTMDQFLPKKIIHGLSGGVDSAVVAALVSIVRGPGALININMPTRYNSREIQEDAREISGSLGAAYRVIPIGEIVDAVALAANVKAGSLAYENIQARTRGNILATVAQAEGGLVMSNGNKDEWLTNYCTLYGDLVGAFAWLADLTKREVRELADYINRVVYQREVIPNSVITRPPSAELDNNQFDPFDYGTVGENGYHDALVRAFMDFRRTPLWVLQEYIKGTLEESMGLKPGRIMQYFKNDLRLFIEDLDKCWKLFQQAFKRNQGPYIFITSRKAFGSDHIESVFPMEELQAYNVLKADILLAIH